MSKRKNISYPCPICEKSSGRKTIEHLPFKALYKSSDIDNAQDRAATIRICETCNSIKSFYDQEILALYGCVSNSEGARKAAQSLRKIRSIKTLDDLAIVAARTSTRDGSKPLFSVDGMPINIESLWGGNGCKGCVLFFQERDF